MALDHKDVIFFKDAAIVLVIHTNILNFRQIYLESLNICHS